MTERKQAKMNIPMCVACVLLCLTLLSAYFTSGLYARYTVTGNGADSARVAMFRITQDHTTFNDEFQMGTAPGVVSRDIQVSNDSEVAVAYTVTIRNLTGNVPYKFRVGESEATLNECSVTTQLAPSKTQTVTLYAIWEKEGALAYMGMVDQVEITIVATQID